MHKDARRTVQIGAFLVFALASRGVLAQDKPPVPPLAADRLAAIDRISSDSLKGHLSFLASDLLEGRGTPSKGLDLAAEYIAAQFRRAGLEPVGDDGYFQTANWELSEPDPTGFRFEFMSDGKSISIDKENVFLMRVGGLDVPPTSTFKLDIKAAELDPEPLAGKVVLVEGSRSAGQPRPRCNRRNAQIRSESARRVQGGARGLDQQATSHPGASR